MPRERFTLSDLRINTVVRRSRNTTIYIPIIMGNQGLDGQEEIWLQIGKGGERHMELESGFKDMNPYALREEGRLRRAPLVRNVEGMLQPTGRRGWWMRLRDLPDTQLFNPKEEK